MNTNIFNPEVAAATTAELMEATDNQHIRAWLKSTFNKWLLAYSPSRTIITDKIASAIEPEVPSVHNLFEVIPEGLLPEWALKSIQAGRPVQCIKRPPAQFHVRQYAIALDDDGDPVPLKYELRPDGSPEPMSWSMEAFGHWVDYLKSLQPKAQLRMTVPDLLNQVYAWDRKIAKQKFTERLESSFAEVECRALAKTEYCIVRLLNHDAYKYEGAVMKHCVATYWGDSSIIWSFRKRGSIKPLVTIEIHERDSTQNIAAEFGLPKQYVREVLGEKTTKVRNAAQAKMFANGDVTREVAAILKPALKELGVKISSTIFPLGVEAPKYLQFNRFEDRAGEAARNKPAPYSGFELDVSGD